MDRDRHQPQEDVPPETVEDREAARDGMTRQDLESEREPAPGRTSFGDDSVTPRLNDGR
ncbi:hypothetical protein [Aureimonas endophytica]|nr:hypothetical protein [Aureimonas endophytica]